MWKEWQAQKEPGKSSSVKQRAELHLAVITFVFSTLFARCLHSKFPKQTFTFRIRDWFPQSKQTLRILKPTEPRIKYLKKGPKSYRLDFKHGGWLSWGMYLCYCGTNKSRGKKVKILSVSFHTAFYLKFPENERSHLNIFDHQRKLVFPLLWLLVCLPLDIADSGFGEYFTGPN